ncbi:MAG: glycosyltransferase family 2 protein [Candidatus Omnitrophica bacterium]|nr:glycosyltransferase family 2 protein [Candidatus Omnitrophota bacterium]MDD5236051.1 glycosyltransferase family 2 protein [Candidatus Omnitrophota bacterium]MDD5609925.1 glycosyltransferase family 2 protein [Candidatus Omnitrophota bacterium]
MNVPSTNRIISVVVVTSGALDHLWRCLSSLREQSYRNLEIILIDNSADENLSKEVNRLYPEVKVSRSGKNLFYGRALNKGIEISSADLILCLNDDVILDKDFVALASRGFEKDARIGMVSGKILRLDKKTIDSTGLFLTIWRTARERGHGKPDTGQYGKEGYIFGAPLAAGFFRRAMLEQIKVEGYFDDDFDMFYEDLDIAWRSHRFSWKAYYLPDAVAYHARGASARCPNAIGKKFARTQLSEALLFELMKNRYLTIIKNETLLGLALHLPFILIYDILAWGYVFFFRPLYLKRLLFTPLPVGPAFRKRKAIMAKRASLKNDTSLL